MNPSFHFDQPQHFTAGAVGPKGERTFYLQFGNPGEVVSLKVEKGQVHALAEFLDQLIEDVELLADEATLALDLIEPVDAEWVVSSIGVAYQEDEREFVVVVEELADDDVEPATARLHLSPGQVQAFIERSRDLVASGRPPCSFCGRPLDDDDGWCPCHN